MYSAWQRLQSAFSFFTSLLLVLGGLVALSSVLYRDSPQIGKVDITKTVVKYSRAPRSYNPAQQEYAHVTFDLQADFTPLFNDWNTKQVFAYLVAEYAALPKPVAGTVAKWKENKVTVWDAIIQTPKKAKVSLAKKRNKYPIGDIAKVFDGRNATFTLYWNTMPHVGKLRWGSYKGSQSITFPPRSAA
ncbi:signal peptidase 22kDa subunit [Protomyces lactucae-debilis]|uniref:Signal peptidase subunit 3 n=1 Tax=Protomyces lactucae-debilis TaxID=2754530 RepID=A0A1Y2F6F6_PROLT|nr:signal peptidase 22kDa subunit [Protomyces lactucae-debilis]ORY79064.1 signal peptidase 22kDa subunit [Protomyces lactucae-debilis]